MGGKITLMESAYEINWDPPKPIEGYSSYQEMINAAQHPSIYERSRYWANVARELIDWESSDFTNVIGAVGKSDSFWFANGTLNVCYNCVDRHAKEDPNRVALLYEGNLPEEGKSITYGELLDRVSKFANVLKSLGIEKGMAVSLYLPVCVEAIVAMLACARIGAVHSLVFGAFRGDALQYRINDCKPTVVITANGYPRANKKIPMKRNLDEIIDQCPTVKHILVAHLIPDPDVMVEGRDHALEPLLEKASNQCPCVPVSSSDPLFYLYTSGSTGFPKGIIHRTGGYAVAACMTARFVFSLRKGDIFGCTSDLGWITGHTYVCYGPLLNGVTTMVFSGLPLYPNAKRPWEMIHKLKLTHFYTSPSAARAIAASDITGADEIDISSLRVIGSVGETLDDSTWHFLYEKLGRKKCYIVDTYWQTEMGSIIATSIPGYLKMKPGFIGHPLFGTEMVLLNQENGKILTSTRSPPKKIDDALLCIASPWPGLANNSLSGNFQSTYIVGGNNFFSTGDLASLDEEGYIKITGRIDDQLCVNGHRVGPAEVEGTIIEHPEVSEAAVIGIPHKISGQAIVAFIVSQNKTQKLIDEVKNIVSNKFSAIGRPSAIYVVDGLPKTRSEKIIRMLLRGLLTGIDVKDPPTLKNPEVMEQIRQIISKK